MSDIRNKVPDETIKVWSDKDVDEFWRLMYLSNKTALSIIDLIEKHR